MHLAVTLCAGFLLTLAYPNSSLALQVGATMDIHTGPVSWDQPEAADPLVNGSLGTSYHAPEVWGLRPELLGMFGVSTGPIEGTAVRWDLGARLHTTGTSSGAWFGAAIGAAGAGNVERQLTRLEGGVRRTLGRARVNVWVSRTGFGGRVVSGGDFNQDSLGTPDTLARTGVTEYTDVGSRIGFNLSRYELGLSLTRRIGNVGNRRNAWEVSATWWATPSVGIVGAAGHSLAQIGYTVPGGRYTTVGLRLAFGARSPTNPARPNRADAKTIAGPVLELEGRRFTIRGAPARQAEVMGDFTDWKPEPLIARGDGQWTFADALTPGVHYLNVRFDGGAWVVPSGISAVDDGFGGRVGLVVAP
jgi:hypothetical protein